MNMNKMLGSFALELRNKLNLKNIKHYQISVFEIIQKLWA